MAGTSRMSREAHVRICGGLEVGFLRSTRRVPRGTEEEKEVFERVVTLREMEAGPPEPPCRGRL